MINDIFPQELWRILQEWAKHRKSGQIVLDWKDGRILASTVSEKQKFS